MKPEKTQLIHPPSTIIGRTLVSVPFTILIAMVGSVAAWQKHNDSITQHQYIMDLQDYRKIQPIIIKYIICTYNYSNFWMVKISEKSAVIYFDNNIFENKVNIQLLLIFSHFKILIPKIHLSLQMLYIKYQNIIMLHP